MKRQSPRHVSGFLSRFLKDTAAPAAGLEWPSVVGKPLGAKSDLLHVRGTTVVVWAETEHIRREILKLESQILHLMLGDRYRSGKLVVTYGERPEVGAGGPRRRNVPAANRGEKHLEQEHVKAVCERIEDDGLREEMERFLSWKPPKGEE